MEKSSSQVSRYERRESCRVLEEAGREDLVGFVFDLAGRLDDAKRENAMLQAALAALGFLLLVFIAL